MIKQPFSALYKRSLSLVELIIISVIIAIVVTILGQKFLDFDDDSKFVAVKQDIRSIEGALRVYYKDNGAYPTTEEGLQNLIVNPHSYRWNGPYLSEELIIDPWGSYYQYESQGDDYIIFSLEKKNR